MNTFGHMYRLTSFGESHGAAIGGVIDGLPALSSVNLQELQEFVASRRPGSSNLTTQRREADKVEFLSGLVCYDPATEEVSAITEDTAIATALGTPIGFMVRNTDARSRDYSAIKDIFRPSHADYTYRMKYGIRDYRGGGRASGRETVARVVAGGIALQQLRKLAGVAIEAHIRQLGTVENPTPDDIEKIIEDTKRRHDSIGAIIECTITGNLLGLGEPTFAKLDQLLGAAMLSIGGVKGVEFGMGFEGVCSYGSEVADGMTASNGTVQFLANNSGGIQGGIANGMPITMRIAVKPTPSISSKLPSTDIHGNAAECSTPGRHDPCIALRIVPVVKAMAAMVIYDAWLMK